MKKFSEKRIANSNENILALMDYFINDLQDRGYRKITPVRGSGAVPGAHTFFVVDSTDTVKRIEVSVDGRYEDDIIAMFDRHSGGVVGSSIYQLCTADPESSDPNNPKLIWWAGKTKEEFVDDLIDMWKVVKSSSLKESKKLKESKENEKNLRERVLDYDTYDKYYDEGAEAFFEGKSLDEVPITGNAWFREAWQEGWKNAKACDEEDVRRLEAEYENELEWEEACREDLEESKVLYKGNPKKVKEVTEKRSIKDWIESEMTDEVKDDVYEFLRCSDKYYSNDLVTYKQFENIMFSNGFDDQDYMWKPLMQESRRRFYAYDREINKQMDSILSSRGISIKPQTVGQDYALYSIEKPNLQVGELMFTPAAYYLAGPRENIYWEGSTLEEFIADVDDMAYAVREVVKSLNESVSKGLRRDVFYSTFRAKVREEFGETELQEATEKLEEVSKLQKLVATTMLALGLGTTAAHAIDMNPKEVTAIEQSAKEIKKKADLADDLSVLSIAIGESLEQIEKIKKGDSDWVRDINPSKTKTKYVLGEKAIKYFQYKLQKEGYDKDIVDAALVLASLTYNFYFDGGTGDLFGKQWKDYRMKIFQEEHPNEKLVGIW